MKTFQKTTPKGWAIVLTLSLIPVVLWATMPTEFARFNNFTNITYSIGKVTGLVGTAMFALNLILGARLKWMESFFNGLNNVYIRHAQLGKIGFLMLLAHPLFLIPVYSGGSWESALRFLIPGSNWAKNFGGMALAMMTVLVVLTIWLRPKYHIWKRTHQLFGLAFFIAALHVYFIGSDVGQYVPLRTYMLGLSGLGLVAYFYRTVLGRFLVRKVTYEVDRVTPLNEDITEIHLKPKGAPLDYNPGQFIFIQFLSDAVGHEVHPFSLTSIPQDEGISITVKNLGDYTSRLKNLTVGTVAKVEGPYGVFSYRKALSKKQVWIAGGVGITPFLGMARSLDPSEAVSVDLYYSVKTLKEAIALEELSAIESKNPNFRLIVWGADEKGYLNANVLEENSGDLKGKSIFLCTPPAMIASLKKQLKAKGVEPAYIHSEEFNF